jgi:hypothetical protein
LEGYLLSKELYWPISARGYDLPRLTIGGILLAQARLEARGERSGSLASQIDMVRSRWRSAWETKAGREVQARMRLWSNYLADYRHNPEGYADAYPHEVRHRVMLQMLLAELHAPVPEQGELSGLDNVLRTHLVDSDFIWEAGLRSVFSREAYWFLYGKLRS